MNIRTLLFSLCFALEGCADSDWGIEHNVPIATSAPPTLNFDNLIVPGDRVGPVSMGGYVDDIVKKLGNPDKVYRSTFRGPGYNADEVHYYYMQGKYAISFTWEDSGLRPVVESGYRGINTSSPYWQTSKGIHVGSSIQDVVNAYGKPDYFEYSQTNMQSTLFYNTGIWFSVKDRNSPVNEISIVGAGDPYHR
jgi:hypothetical protein